MMILILLISAVFLALISFLIFKKRSKPSQSLVLQNKPGFLSGLSSLFSSSSSREETLLKLEEKLIEGDFGIEATQALLADMGDVLGSSEASMARIKEKMMAMLDDGKTFSFSANKPHVLMMVGINGVGKTTTVAKLAHWAIQNGKKVLLVAGDTFRAAAGEQLEVWAKRTGSDIIKGNDQTDPASLVFDGIKKAIATGADFVLVDTAGRLHTKMNLMEELKKMVRVAEKSLTRPVDDIFLVLDSTTGQNGLSQARDFLGAIPLTGIVLTKFDGSAKGGIVFAIRQKTGLPIRFVGVGEKEGDLKPFITTEFVDKIFN